MLSLFRHDAEPPAPAGFRCCHAAARFLPLRYAAIIIFRLLLAPCCGAIRYTANIRYTLLMLRFEMHTPPRTVIRIVHVRMSWLSPYAIYIAVAGAICRYFSLFAIFAMLFRADIDITLFAAFAAMLSFRYTCRCRCYFAAMPICRYYACYAITLLICCCHDIIAAIHLLFRAERAMLYDIQPLPVSRDTRGCYAID